MRKILIILAILSQATSFASIFTSSPKESYHCRPDRTSYRGAALEIHLTEVELKPGPSKAVLELISDGTQVSKKTANLLRTELDQKKYIVAATKAIQVSINISEQPYRGTLSMESQEDEIEISCTK